MFSFANPCVVISSSAHLFLRPPNRPLLYNPTQFPIFRSSITKIKATIDEKEQKSPYPVIVEEEDEVGLQPTPSKVHTPPFMKFGKIKGMQMLTLG